VCGSGWLEGGSCNPAPSHLLQKGAPYPFGVDPMWTISSNKLSYYNSLKMKMSIVLGVIQMLFGIGCKVANALYFKRPKDLWFEAIPEAIFLSSTFGYLVILILKKWSTDFVAAALPAPSLLDALIHMFMSPGARMPSCHDGVCDSECYSGSCVLYGGQETVQLLLLLIAVCCVPIILLPKPFLLKREHEEGYRAISMDEEADGKGGETSSFDFGEVVVHQTIHTIEFVLGCVSNTASYLRLWALSLAHAELSEVFWDRVFLYSLKAGGWLLLFGAFAVWTTLTFVVLMSMESLSASLHDLRLHWVEYMNKFYKGDGYAFTPLRFKGGQN